MRNVLATAALLALTCLFAGTATYQSEVLLANPRQDPRGKALQAAIDQTPWLHAKAGSPDSPARPFAENGMPTDGTAVSD